MKKFLLILISFGLLATFFACQNPDLIEDKQKEKGQSLDQDKKDEDDSKSKIALSPYVMVDGKLYKDTGYLNNLITCATMDGKVDKVISVNEVPKEDDTSNFAPCEYQYASDGFITIKYEGKYLLFASEDKTWEDMKKYVSHFTAKVKAKVKDMNAIELVDVEVPDEFKYAFKNEDKNPEPFVVRLDNARIMKDGKDFDTMDIVSKKVIVYFDGKALNKESTSSALVTIENVYAVEVID